MALDFNIALGISPAFPTAAADAFHGAPVDYCYEDFGPVEESFNVPTLPAWAIVTAAYSFTSDSRPNLSHVAVSFTGPGNMAGKHFTFCGCDAAQHERACWHVSAVKAFEEAALAAVALVDAGPVDFDGDAFILNTEEDGLVRVDPITHKSTPLEACPICHQSGFRYGTTTPLHRSDCYRNPANSLPAPARETRTLKAGDQAEYTNPVTGARIDGRIAWVNGDIAALSYFNRRMNRTEQLAFNIANLTPVERRAA